MTVRCDTVGDNTGGRLVGWTRSPDGDEFNTVQLNTNASKYAVNSNPNTGFTTLTITNINESDEGLYRCRYENANKPRHCILVHGEFSV